MSRDGIKPLQANSSLPRATFTEAYVHFRRCEDDLSAAISLNKVAYCQSQCGDLVGAGQTLETCLDMAKALGESHRVTVVAHNLGKVRRMNGRIRESQRLYTEYSIPPETADKKAYVFYCCVSSIPSALLGRVDDARRIILQARPYLDEYAREKAIFYENLGLIELLAENYKVAESTLLAGLTIALAVAPRSSLVSQNKRLLADVYVATEAWDKAEEVAQETLSLAIEIDEYPEIAACHRTMAQIASRRGDRKAARDLFQRAIDAFHQMHFRYELAVTRYLAATSGLYANGEQAALLYLAREYFVSEDIRQYIEKVDKVLREEPYRQSPRTTDKGKAPAIISRSQGMQRVLDLAQRVACSERPVLLTGETGTGKDLLARFIHYHSGRKGEFVSVNTAAVPSEMVEAELFGHTKGAYTGAMSDRAGLFEQAAEGTLYLNEIGDASSEFQAKLLEVIETRQMRRLGQDKLRPVTCRFIAATNHDLQERIRENRFRLDLYHRLNHLSLAIPPLRERTGDIPLLIEHFLQAEGFAPNANGDRAALKRLSLVLAARPWPGNVRQFQAEIQRLLLVSGRDLASMADLALAASGSSDEQQLVAVLDATDWNNSRAAEILGVSEGAIRKRIRKFGLSK